MANLPLPPNPGSYEAIALGCACPVLDNNHGLYPPFPPDSYYVVEGCTLHGFADELVSVPAQLTNDDDTP